MKKIGTYWKIYIAMLLVLVIAGIIMAIYTKNSLETYEKCQPSNLVKKEMGKVQNAAKYKTLDAIMDVSKYDENVLNSYYELMTNAKTWSYKAISGGYSDTAQVWGIYADDKLVAQVNLSGSNTRNMLLILTASDWEVSGLVSGLDFMATPTPGATSGPVYVTKYEYELTLPASYTIISENMVVEGADRENNQKYYKFVTTDEVIIIKDTYGQEVNYKHGDSLSAHNVLVKIPDVFGITLNGAEVTKYALEEKEDIKALKVCYEFAENLPKLVTYQFDNALIRPAFEITDQNGAKVEYEYEGDTVTFTNLVKEEKVPDEITSVTDIMDIAEKWSLLMTRDLGTKEEKYGYNVMKKYIAKDSPLLTVASSYIKSEIWTISDHVLANPPFSNESFGGYTRYSDNIFSVDVRLTKKMLVRNASEVRTDTVSDTIFFIRNTGSGEPWLMVDMMSNLDK